MSFEATAPDANWTIVCEAREDTNGDGTIATLPGPRGELSGDRLQRYLVLGNGEARPIDDLLAATPDGNFLVVRREGRAELVNTKTLALRELPGLELRSDSAIPARRNVVAENDAVHYLRRTPGGESEVVLYSLRDGTERVLYAAREGVLGLEPDPGGAYVVVEVVGADKNGNGRLDRPAAGDPNPRPCRGPLPRVRARRADVDAAGFVVVPRAGGRARRVDDLALVFGRELIRRRPDGALLGELDGRTRMLGDATCRGRVLFAEPERNLLLIGCALAKKPGRLGVDLVTAGSRRSLAIDVAELLTDEPVRPGVRLFALYPGADTVLFDAERQTLRRFEPGDAILAVYEQRALVRRGRTALVYDARTDRIATLPGKIDPLFETLQTGPMVYVGSLVVDLGTGRCVGSVSGRALALSTSGEVLLATVPASAEALARGPLLWRAPEPVR